MTARRVIFGVVAVAFAGAMALGVSGEGSVLDPALWGAGVADSPYCRIYTWWGRSNC